MSCGCIVGVSGIEHCDRHSEANVARMERIIDLYRAHRCQGPDARLRAALERLHAWTLRHGSDLCPQSGDADSFGDGMRRAKKQVAEILAAAKEAP